MKETRGVLFFNRGDKCAVRLIVAIYSLRKHYKGDITVFLEEPYPHELDTCCDFLGCKVIHSQQNLNSGALVRKTELFVESPYDRTLWIDADTITLGPVDEMFDLLDKADVVIPHFAGWISSGNAISGRIKKYKGMVDEKILDEALNKHPAINTGILSYRKNIQFMKDWIELAQKGDGKMFIADEVAFQVLYPSYPNILIAPLKYNVSVRFGEDVEDKRIIHYHGQKHLWENSLGQIWKDTFSEMRKDNIAGIEGIIKYADRRLAKFLNVKRQKIAQNKGISMKTVRDDVTIVTACDEYYVDILRETFANWRKYKKIDQFPVMVFVHGIPLEDKRLDFLKLPNVTIIPWAMPELESHREEMLSAFVLGTAENVTTEFWLKLDADSFAINDKPLFAESMKKYAFCGHKWHYSRPDHIKLLDEWAKNHRQPKLKNATPMLSEGKIEGNRFFHKKRRTISFIQLHKTKFTRFCVKLLGGTKRLPAPTQDTYMFYVCDRFDPQFIGVANFKKDHGFVQGRGKLGAENIKKQLVKVDDDNKELVKEISPVISSNKILKEPVNIKVIDLGEEVVEIESKKSTIVSIPFTDKNGVKTIVQVEE